MNLAFIGDALDHWKGSIFESLQGAGLLRDFAVDPMATDHAAWSTADTALYARLLRIKPSQILRHRYPLRDRRRYFAEIAHAGDLFLDPDTGVATGEVLVKHISPGEVVGLLDAISGRLVALYQHVRAQRTSERVAEVISAIRAAGGTFGWATYESPTVAMVFASRDQRRSAAIADHFRGLLGPHAGGRIGSG